MLRRDVISGTSASGAAYQGRGNRWQYGDNKNTPYCHALFAYNQMVKSKCDISGIRFEKKICRSLSPQENKLEIA